jgi:hypothetical protein
VFEPLAVRRHVWLDILIKDEALFTVTILFIIVKVINVVNLEFL